LCSRSDSTSRNGRRRKGIQVNGIVGGRKKDEPEIMDERAVFPGYSVLEKFYPAPDLKICRISLFG